MKITSRDKELIFLVLSIGIVAASWFLGAKDRGNDGQEGRAPAGIR